MARCQYLEAMRRIALVNPYSAGSHAQWAQGMARELPAAAKKMGRGLTVEVFSLPGRHWKWRMHAAALTLVARMEEASLFEAGVDAYIVTDMLDVGQFRSALPPAERSKPVVLYFHENQLTFPAHPERPAEAWDRHYAFMNVTGALLADAVWFNSVYHRNLFLEALPAFMSAFPSPRPTDSAAVIAAKSKVIPIGIEDDVFTAGKVDGPGRFGEGPPVVAWNHRWEYDKGPAAFLACLDAAAAEGLAFRLAVMGQSFDQVPEAFGLLRQRHADRIVSWGHLESRAEYVEALRSSDVALVTAHHDFFGISVLEAAAAGLEIVAPRALAYPEHFGADVLCARSDLEAAFQSALTRRQKRNWDVGKYAWSRVAHEAIVALLDV